MKFWIISLFFIIGLSGCGPKDTGGGEKGIQSQNEPVAINHDDLAKDFQGRTSFALLEIYYLLMKNEVKTKKQLKKLDDEFRISCRRSCSIEIKEDL